MTLLKPVLTEKSMQNVSNGKYMFEVTNEASKTAIQEAVEAMYQVKVVSVNTQVRPGKTKRVMRRRTMTHTSKRHYAIVTLVKGQKIAGFDKALQIEEESNEKV